MDAKPSFERIFRLTGFHLGAAATGFLVAALLYAPKPRAPTAMSARVAQILELRSQARAAASAAPNGAPNAAPSAASASPSANVGAGTAVAPGASRAASTVAGPALARATELCKALAWPACDADSVLAMGKLP